MKKNSPPSLIIRMLDKPITLLLMFMLVSTPFLLWLAWALSQPASRLEKAAKKVAKGIFIEDPSLEKGMTEFRLAGKSFNQMVLAVNQMMSGQQRLLSDISHELRSPLTRLRMANALAVRKTGNSAELHRIDMEAERLEQMISDLLALSRIQIGSYSTHNTLTINELWEEILDDAQFEAEQVNKTFDYSSLPESSISGASKLLMSAVDNILRNAIRYAHYQITTQFTLEGEQLKIVVMDDGEGVPEDEFESIFHPFYRVSTSRERDSGGTGLGLAITKNAIHQHNGKIEASQSELGGLKVTIYLPIV